MEENKKSNKGLIVLVVILSIALLGAIGYICYDKFMVKVEDPKQEEPKQVEKLSEEEVAKLHDSLINHNNSYGFYFSEKTSIDEMDSKLMVSYVISNIIYDNKIGINENYMVCGDSSTKYYLCDKETNKAVSEDKVKNNTLSKDVVDNYIKENFGTDRDFVIDGKIVSIGNTRYEAYYNSVKEEYYLVNPPRSFSDNSVKSVMTKSEQTTNDEIVIFDKFVSCWSEVGNYECSKVLYTSLAEEEKAGNANKLFYAGSDENGELKFFDNNNKVISGGEKYLKLNTEEYYEFNYDSIFSDFDSNLNLFKHTFKKADDSKYYWYSSEIVKE